LALEYGKPLEEVITDDLFGVLYADSMNPIVLLDARSLEEPFPQILRVNAAFTKLTGYGAEDAVGRSPRFMRGPATNPDTIQHLLESCRERKASTEEIAIFAKDGREVWVQITLTPFNVPDASLILMVYRDISRRHQIHQELAERTEMLERAEALGHVGHWNWDIETNVVYWSDEIYRIHGLDHTDEVQRGSPVIFHHPDDRDDVKQQLNYTKQTAEDCEFELRIIRPDGEVRYVNVKAFGNKDADGRVHEVFGLLEDITRSKQAEFLLKAERDRLFDALDSIGGGAMLLDKYDRLVFANRPFVEAFAHIPDIFQPGTPYETILRRIMEGSASLLNVDDLDGWIDNRMEKHRRCEGLDAHRLGNGRWLHVIEHRTREGGILLIRLDVTEQYEAQEQLRQAKEEAEFASRSKTGFLANMSHELRTPLNAIIGFGEMIKLGLKGNLPNDYKRYAGDIVDSGQHLLGIINDILDIAKIEGGSVTLEEELEDIERLVRATLPLIAQSAIANDTEIEIDIAADLPALRCDGLRMKQILLNLLSNAVKFTPEGTVSVVIKLVSGNIQVRIADTGIGMRTHDIELALTPFGQIDENHLTRRFQGTGLGLPMALELTELQGGQFDIESAPGEGTTITLTFPV